MAFHAKTGGLLGAALLVLGTLVASPTYADSFARVRVMSNEDVASATGRTVTEWGNAWWKWAFNHPEVLGDTTGEFASLGDVRGPVFFLEGSGGEPFNANVDVPRGEYVLLPVATYIWTFFDPCAEVRCARRIINDNFLKGIDIDDVFVWIDGKQVGNLASHIVRVDRFNPQVFLVGRSDRSRWLRRHTAGAAGRLLGHARTAAAGAASRCLRSHRPGTRSVYGRVHRGDATAVRKRDAAAGRVPIAPRLLEVSRPGSRQWPYAHADAFA